MMLAPILAYPKSSKYSLKLLQLLLVAVVATINPQMK